MSRDGPQSGPYQHEPDEPYHPPSDPWDGQDPWGGPTMPNAPYSGAAQPGGGWSGGGGAGGQETGHVPGGGYGPPAPPAMSTGYGYSQPGWSAPAPPPSRRTGWLVALVIVLVLVVAGGVAAALLVLRDRSPGGTAGPTAAPTADPTPTPTATATAEPDPSALPNVGLDASFARPDDCVVNVGTEDAVALQVVDCDEPDVEDDATVYLVLTRHEGGPAGQEVAEEKCGEDPGDGEYTNWYYFDSPTPALSFVLCLNKIDR
jgi:hypothetical protein